VNLRASLRETPVLQKGQKKRVFKAVLIYENFAAGVRARWFCERLIRALDGTLEEQMWNFDTLRIREARNAAASAARKADVVIVSVSGHTQLPGTIRAWLDMWLWLHKKENPALVALFDSPARRSIGSICAYLSSIARRSMIDFFPHETTRSVCPERDGFGVGHVHPNQPALDLRSQFSKSPRARDLKGITAR
jgi:hypothetical protein